MIYHFQQLSGSLLVKVPQLYDGLDEGRVQPYLVLRLVHVHVAFVYCEERIKRINFRDFLQIRRDVFYFGGLNLGVLEPRHLATYLHVFIGPQAGEMHN